MVTCGCTVLDSDSPCLAAQGWDSIDPTLLRTQPEKVAHVFGIGSELRVLLLELELPQLFSSHLYIYIIYICALQRPAGVSRGIAQPTCPLHAQWAVSGLSVNHEP